MTKELKIVYGYIYKITNLINGKIYIGQTINTIEKRFQNHYTSSKRNHSQDRPQPITRAIHKHGIKNFKCELIQTASSVNELNYLEKYYISKYNCFCSIGIGYNLAEGGQCGNLRKGFSKEDYQEYLKKLSISHKGRIRINNSTEYKMIWPEELEDYLLNGWLIGTGNCLSYDASYKTKQSWETRRKNGKDKNSKESNIKRSQTLNNKTLEEKQEIILKKKNAYEQTPKYIKQERIKKQLETKQNKTQEEKDLVFKRKSESCKGEKNPSFSKRWINKQGIKNYIKLSDLDIWIKDGWTLGQK